MKEPQLCVRAVTGFVRLPMLVVLPLLAFADNVLRPGTPVLDRPTLTAIGVKLPVTGDDNFNASVSVRYRKAGSTNWTNALPLFRVHPETTVPYTIAPQFAGSIFDLRPATTYELELSINDPDGPVSQRLTLSATTRPVPRDPVTPRNRAVTNSSELTQALGSAQPGDVINLADGVYTGSWSIGASGTQQNPIIIRGTSQTGTILDGANCSCNIIDVYGSWVHVERMTLRNAMQGIRFQTAGAQGNVLRRVYVKNTQLGMNTRTGQLDFYIADNIFEGRLQWPLTYADDGAAHGNDDGIRMEGFGHVVAHNRISGYGDAMKIEQAGARSVDFYGNDVLWSYDNGLELDDSEGNSRALRNRLTNTYSPLSVQPINGGPAYIVRNISVNSVYGPLKFHGVGGGATPNGVFVYNNTFVTPYESLTMQAGVASHYFEIKNNLFVGPAVLRRGVTVDWYGVIDHGVFDYNGYWPNGYFCYLLPTTYIKAPNFAALQTYGIETHGTLLGSSIFKSGLIAPASHYAVMSPQDVTLAADSSAADRGAVLPNITDGYMGAAPDLGALETGCPQPIYGPRPEGTDETNEPFGCTPSVPAPAAAATTISLGVPAALTYSTADQNITLSATVTSTAGTVNGGDVIFRANGAAAGQTPLANGTASVVYRIPAGTAAGTQYSFTADYTGTAAFAASTAAARVMSIANPPPSTPGAAVKFIQSDTTTAGNWKGVYGGDGYSIANAVESLPSWATFGAASGWSLHTWAATTADARALQRPGGTDRLATCWYQTTSATLNVKITDGAAHRVAIYMLDWDRLNRQQKVEVLDVATGAVLDTRNVAAFSNGMYLVWEVSGNVQIRVTNTGTTHAVVSAVLFGGNSTPTTQPPPPSPSAGVKFLQSDTTTSGNWKGVYGTEGYSIPAGPQSYSAGATMTAGSGWYFYSWAASTADPRALQRPGGNDRLATCWYMSATAMFDVRITDNAAHRVALYMLDWDRMNRQQRVEVLDSSSGAVLDTRDVSAFNNGVYLVWELSRSVLIRVTNTGPWNAVVSGFFFGANAGTVTQPPTPSPAPAAGNTAKFVQSDATTKGAWKGVYGADGYVIPNGGGEAYPSWAGMSVGPGWNLHTWAASTTDLRALQRTTGTDRLATCWYQTASAAFNVRVTDGGAHRVALYMLDWDRLNRQQRFEILDGDSGAVLDRRDLSGFIGGVYLVWEVTGNVQIRVTNTSLTQAVVSGIFFR